MACGAGLYMEAALATVIVFMCAAVHRFAGVRGGVEAYPMLYEVRGDGSEQRCFSAILAGAGCGGRLRLNVLERDSVGELERITFAI